MPPRSLTFLGPQGRRPILEGALDHFDPEGPVALICAGWEEREFEVEEFEAHIGRPMIPLSLYQRSEELFATRRDLLEGMWRANDVIDRLQDAYRVQLAGALDAARLLLESDPTDAPRLKDYQDDAIEVVRGIDARHLERLTSVQAELDAEQRWDEDENLARHRLEVHTILRNCAGLCVAGGHVLVLLQRLRMFEIGAHLDDVPIVAWSAGAMALSERVVLFHHDPPQGQNNSEVAAAGLGVGRDIVIFPHAKHRLDLRDRERVSLLARRFAPAACITLDAEERVDWDGSKWRGFVDASDKPDRARGARRLTADGSVELVEVACR